MSGKGQRVPDRKIRFPAWRFRRFFGLHDLCHKISHCLRRPVLLLPGGVGVGTESETRVVMAQHTGDRFHVHAVLEGQGCECVPQVVEADVFQASILQYLFMELYH